MRLGATVVAVVLLGPTPLYAKDAPAAPRFPAAVSDLLLRDLVAIGRVEATMPREPDEWLRWGGAPVEHQASAMRAVVEALSAARPPIDVAAAVLTIARVESGWNPYSRNPTSSACGLFQFVHATWAAYEPEQNRCFDPKANAAAGVKHLIGLYRTRVAPLLPVAGDADRLTWTYRMLYAFHYHGEGTPEAADGGSTEVQAIADAGVPSLQGFFSVLKRATTVVAARSPRRRGRARHGQSARS